MKFFSGFCFKNEEELFAPLIQLEGQYTLNGFSYGAILAFKEALKSIQNFQRVQVLNLFSPAFFQDRKPSFLKAQILGFKKDPQTYIQNFLTLCGNPPDAYFKQGTLEELEELLLFQWKEEELSFLQEKGVQINVFIGGADLILSPETTMQFFSPYSVVYFYKDFNHCLQCDHL